MSKAKEIQNNITAKGKSVLGCVADIIETATQRNLALAGGVSKFAIAQVRLPVEAASFDDYRDGTGDAYSGLGLTVGTFGRELAANFREIPQQFKTAWSAGDMAVDVVVEETAPAAKSKPAAKAKK
jgi:hypothetical protein